MAPGARLLVALSRSLEASRSIAEHLPGIPFIFASESPSGPWPSVEAMLVGTLEREIPQYRFELTPKLRFVQGVYTGLDGFPFSAFPPGVFISGNVGGFATAVAEHALSLVLALAKSSVALDAQARSGRLRPAVPTKLVKGKRVLLVGYGRIAREVAARLRPFDVIIEAVGRNGGATEAQETIHPITALNSTLPAADVIINCLPLTRSTAGLFDSAAFLRMKPEAIFVNVGRAGTVSEDALYDRLTTEPGFRAGLDVLWGEDFDRGIIRFRRPFDRLPNAVLSPHVAGYTEGSRPEALSHALENLARFFAGTPPRHLADRSEYLQEDVVSRSP